MRLSIRAGAPFRSVCTAREMGLVTKAVAKCDGAYRLGRVAKIRGVGDPQAIQKLIGGHLKMAFEFPFKRSN